MIDIEIDTEIDTEIYKLLKHSQMSSGPILKIPVR